jgi:hypothetical protein
VKQHRVISGVWLSDIEQKTFEVDEKWARGEESERDEGKSNDPASMLKGPYSEIGKFTTKWCTFYAEIPYDVWIEEERPTSSCKVQTFPLKFPALLADMRTFEAPRK